MTRFQLGEINKFIDLPDGKVAMYVEACVWCLDYHGHQNGSDLDVLFERKNNIYQVYWPDDLIELEKIRAYYNNDDAVESGAEVIAFFVCLAHTDYDRLNRSFTKTGIDYWLGHKSTNPNLPFQNSGRLEISGILKETDTNSVEKRIKEKLKQSAQSDHTTLPVYVVVVAFDQPYAKMVVKNVNS